MIIDLSVEQIKEVIHALTETDPKFLNNDDYRGLFMKFRYALDRWETIQNAI